MKPLADDEPEPEAFFEGDVVTKYTPPSFALEFVRASGLADHAMAALVARLEALRGTP